MSVLSTGSPDPEDPRPTPDEPASPAVARAGATAGTTTAGTTTNAGMAPGSVSSERLAGSPPPAPAAPHEGLVGEPGDPLGDDPRPGNVGHSAEAARADDHEDVLDEAADESFPASDPPSWSAAPTTGEEVPDPAGTPEQHGLGRVVEG